MKEDIDLPRGGGGGLEESLDMIIMPLFTFSSLLLVFYDYKALELNDGFLSLSVMFYDYKASDLNDGLLS